MKYTCQCAINLIQMDWNESNKTKEADNTERNVKMLWVIKKAIKVEQKGWKSKKERKKV